jgi:dynein heavy chain
LLHFPFSGQINYGGRVTDEHDQKLIRAVLREIFNEKILDDRHPLCPSSSVYYAPPSGDRDSYVRYITDLPINDPPVRRRRSERKKRKRVRRRSE